MNKKIYEIKKVGTIKEISHTDESLIIIADKKIEIATYHEPDCCEHVYGDFSILKYHLEFLKGKKITSISIKGVEDMGFLLVFHTEYEEFQKIFIACYNYQNGYYSDSLSLTVTEDELKKVEVDISALVEDHIED